MSEETDIQTLAERLHDHLRATEERPVERTASRWVGEAQAVAADAADGAADAVVEKRARQVVHLLENVDGTGDEAADDHIEAARAIAERLVERFEEA